jgi:putative hydrolase of the HAD superfamily
VIQAVVSDFGGVLTRPLLEAFTKAHDGADVPLAAYGQALWTAAQRDGVNPLFELEKGRMTEREFNARLERELAEILGRPASLDGITQRVNEVLEPNQDLFDYYASLRDRGVRLALCTNNVREWEPLWRPKLPIDDIFETVVDSAFVGTRKPEPEIYGIVLERLGLPAEACAFVDDLEINVAAARELGFRGVHFTDTGRAIAELEDLVLGT